VGYLGDCGDMGIEVLPPDVQVSGSRFTVESPVSSTQGQIRFGLNAVKNVGEGAVDSIIEARKKGRFESLYDFCERVDTRLVNKRVVESLIKAGAMDSMGSKPKHELRPQLLELSDEALDSGIKRKDTVHANQGSLFGESELKAVSKKIILKKDSNARWSESDLLAAEKDVLGLYFSGHPLKRYQAEMASYTTCTLGRLPDSATVRVAGHILSARRMTTKRGNLMARFVLEDLEGSAEVMVFPKALTPEINELLHPGSMVVVKGQVEGRTQDDSHIVRQILSEEILSFEAARLRFVRELTVRIPSSSDDGLFNMLKELFGKYPGNCRVILLMPSEKGEVFIETRAGVKPSKDFVSDLEKIVGSESWTFGKHTFVSSNNLANAIKPQKEEMACQKS
jgi:DNA polymerase-3 subunit alpha